MNLSFHAEFVPKIIDGSKIHTLREDKHNRWGAGRRIDFCTGLRTRNYKCFRRGVCDGTQDILIRGREVWIDGSRVIDPLMIERLAKNDGFDCVGDFFGWFSKDFNGKIVHFTGFRYCGGNMIICKYCDRQFDDDLRISYELLRRHTIVEHTDRMRWLTAPWEAEAKPGNTTVYREVEEAETVHAD